jgi:ABC-type uncharacterized transport system permease subunit
MLQLPNDGNGSYPQVLCKVTLLYITFSLRVGCRAHVKCVAYVKELGKAGFYSEILCNSRGILFYKLGFNIYSVLGLFYFNPVAIFYKKAV